MYRGSSLATAECMIRLMLCLTKCDIEWKLELKLRHYAVPYWTHKLEVVFCIDSLIISD